uniref:Uncharacterized protein n=1 Tax=Aplanochytrium stocchinoi TaxID=215587 RepID=A0A7S3PDV7_9STRA
MHIQVLNSRLEKKGYLDTVNMRIMRSIAIFWPYYIGIVIVTGFLIAGKIRNILRLLRVFFCLVSVMFATSVTFNAYYFVKVAKTIEKAAERRLSLHAHAQEGSRNPADEWKRIAWLSKFVGMYAFFIGGPVFILFIVFIVLNTFVNPTAMLVTWTIAGVGILSPIVIFTYWFKKGGLLVCFFDRKKPERRISRFMSVPDL